MLNAVKNLIREVNKGENRHAARAASGDFSSLEFGGDEIATLGEPFNRTRGRPLTGRRIVRALKGWEHVTAYLQIHLG